MAADSDNADEERRIAEVLRIAESLSGDDVYDGYSRVGLATTGTLRFKWVAKAQDDGRFVVHETVGGGAVPVSSRPMPKEQVLDYIDQRQMALRQKIEGIKRELNAVQSVLPGAAEPETSEKVDPVAMYDEIARMLKETK